MVWIQQYVIDAIALTANNPIKVATLFTTEAEKSQKASGEILTTSGETSPSYCYNKNIASGNAAFLRGALCSPVFLQSIYYAY